MSGTSCTTWSSPWKAAAARSAAALLGTSSRPILGCTLQMPRTSAANWAACAMEVGARKSTATFTQDLRLRTCSGGRGQGLGFRVRAAGKQGGLSDVQAPREAVPRHAPAASMAKVGCKRQSEVPAERRWMPKMSTNTITQDLKSYVFDCRENFD